MKLYEKKIPLPFQKVMSCPEKSQPAPQKQTQQNTEKNIEARSIHQKEQNCDKGNSNTATLLCMLIALDII